MRRDSDNCDSAASEPFSDTTSPRTIDPAGKLSPIHSTRDAEQREVQLVGADVLTLGHPGEPLLRHHPVLVVRQVQEASGLSVQVTGLDKGGHVAGAQSVVEKRVDFL